jgi:hypothetical protein
MTSKKSYKELENEATRGRKRYLERVQEEAEAEEEIKQFSPEQLELDFPERDGE